MSAIAPIISDNVTAATSAGDWGTKLASTGRLPASSTKDTSEGKSFGMNSGNSGDIMTKPLSSSGISTQIGLAGKGKRRATAPELATKGPIGTAGSSADRAGTCLLEAEDDYGSSCGSAAEDRQPDSELGSDNDFFPFSNEAGNDVRVPFDSATDGGLPDPLRRASNSHDLTPPSPSGPVIPSALSLPLMSAVPPPDHPSQVPTSKASRINSIDAVLSTERSAASESIASERLFSELRENLKQAITEAEGELQTSESQSQNTKTIREKQSVVQVFRNQMEEVEWIDENRDALSKLSMPEKIKMLAA